MKSKILVISSTAFFGGGEQFIVNTLSRLENEFDVKFLINNDILESKLPTQNVVRFSSNNKIAQLIQIKQLIKRWKPELLVFNGSNISYFAPLFSSVKKIYFRHTTNNSVPLYKRWLFEILMNVLYLTSDMTIHVSKYSLSEQHFGNKVCIHNGIHILPFEDKKEACLPLSILYCGRLEKAKGIIQVIEAFKQIDPSVAKLRIVGDGSLKDWIRTNVTSSIEFAGYTEKVQDYYNSSDALILMSDFENFPLSVIEAMNSGLPIITNGVGGISEMVINNYNGLIIPSSKSDVIKAINYLAHNTQELHRLGSNAYKFTSENLNQNDKVSEIKNVIRQIIKK